MQKINRAREAWEEHIRVMAGIAAQGPQWPTTGAVRVSCLFTFARPKCHFGTGRNAHILKANASDDPTTRNQGDLDVIGQLLKCLELDEKRS